MAARVAPTFMKAVSSTSVSASDPGGEPLAAGADIILHSENGVIGMGPAPAPGEEDYDLINAGKQPSPCCCGSYFHHATASP